MSKTRWKKSIYTVTVKGSRDELILYNSFMGAIVFGGSGVNRRFCLDSFSL